MSVPSSLNSFFDKPTFFAASPDHLSIVPAFSLKTDSIAPTDCSRFPASSWIDLKPPTIVSNEAYARTPAKAPLKAEENLPDDSLPAFENRFSTLSAAVSASFGTFEKAPLKFPLRAACIRDFRVVNSRPADSVDCSTRRWDALS